MFEQTLGIMKLLCWVSLCLLRSTFLWNLRPHRSHENGLYPVCFLVWVIRLLLWLNAFPQTMHLCGFSPENIFFKNHLKYISMIFMCLSNTGCSWSRETHSWPEQGWYINNLGWAEAWSILNIGFGSCHGNIGEIKQKINFQEKCAFFLQIRTQWWLFGLLLIQT